MEEEKSIFDQPRQPYSLQQTLPNAVAALVLGICSIVICFVGLVLSIIALVLANKDLKLYNASPEAYTVSSYNNLKAGRICAIVGLVLQSLLVLVYAVVIVIALAAGASGWR